MANLDGVLYATSSGGTALWSLGTGAEIDGAPGIASDGTIYVANFNGVVYAVSPSPALLWTYTTGGPIVTAPAIAADGTIYVGTLGGHGAIEALNSNGSERWFFSGNTGNYASSPVIAADGTLYEANSDHNLYAINTSSTGTVGATISRALGLGSIGSGHGR